MGDICNHIRKSKKTENL